MNRNGYKMYNGKYKLKDESSEFKQIEFEQRKTLVKRNLLKLKRIKTLQIKK